MRDGTPMEPTNVPGIGSGSERQRTEAGVTTSVSDQGAGGRRESFLVTLLSDASGGPPRSIVRHVRSEEEAAWAGWDPDRLVRFIVQHADLPVNVNDPCLPAERTVRPVADRSPGAPVVTTLDAGRVIGGRRPLEFVLATDGLAAQGLDAFAFDATITARGLGSDDRQPIVRLNGAGTVRRQLPLRTPLVELPPGPQRLEIAISVQPAPNDGKAPAVRLATP